MRIGQKNKWVHVKGPTCECGEFAEVSRTKGGITTNYCLACKAKPPQVKARNLEIAGLLQELGLI